jgi:hypothetical protein
MGATGTAERPKTPRVRDDLTRIRQGLVAAGIAVVVAACGGGIVPGGGSTDAAPTSSPLPTVDVPDVVPINCPDEVIELVETLEDLDSRLSVGLNFSAYSERVGDARVAYDRIDVGDLDSGCIEHVGAPAEDAMNAYINAYNVWNDCIGDIDCDNDSITPELQAEWADATELIQEARDGLDQ